MKQKKIKVNLSTFQKSFIFIILTLIVGFFIILSFSREIIKAKLYELEQNFSHTNRIESKNDAISLFTKFRINDELKKNAMSEGEIPLKEAEIAYIMEQEIYRKSQDTQNPSFIIIKLLNIINKTRNKPIIVIKKNENYIKQLNLAYFYERNRKYQKAVEHFQILLDDKNYPDYLKEITNLHIAYCKALNADFNDAATIFNEIILANPNSDNATTALILLRYFKDLEKSINQFSAHTQTIPKLETAYLQLSYKKTLGILESFNLKKLSPENRSYILYYIARCHEEIGDTETAIEDYQKLISLYPTSIHARNANKRIFTVAILNPNYEKLKEVSMQLNLLIKDDDFLDFAKTISQYNLDEARKSELGSYVTKEEKEKTSKLIDKIESHAKKIITPIQEKIETQNHSTLHNKPIQFQKRQVKTYKNEFVNIIDQKGNAIKSFYYDESGLIAYYFVNEYNQDKLVTKKITYSPDHKVQSWEEYDYDHNAILKTTHRFNANGEAIK